MTARWILLVGPRDLAGQILDTSRLHEALESIHVLRMAAPSLRIALYQWEPTTGACLRVLRIEGGVRYDELPELLTEEVPPPADPAVGSATNAPLELPVRVVRCSVPVR